MSNPYKIFVEEPKPSDGLLWRYMDLSKFLDFLQRRALFFSRLENMDDPLEGYQPRGYWEAIKNAKTKVHGPPLEEGFEEMYLNSEKKLVPIHKRYACINCWHQNKMESDAMWRLYGGDDKGIAIQTSVESLKNCFLNQNSYEVVLGKIGYVDYRDFSNRQYNPMGGFQKDLSYKHEEEVRAVIWSKDVDGKTFDEMLSMPISNGHHISVDPEKLVEKVYLSPKVSEWNYELLENLIEKYEINVPIVPSVYRSVPEDLLPNKRHNVAQE